MSGHNDGAFSCAKGLSSKHQSAHGRCRVIADIGAGLIVDKANFSVQAYRVLSSGLAILEE